MPQPGHLKGIRKRSADVNFGKMVKHVNKETGLVADDVRVCLRSFIGYLQDSIIEKKAITIPSLFSLKPKVVKGKLCRRMTQAWLFKKGEEHLETKVSPDRNRYGFKLSADLERKLNPRDSTDQLVKQRFGD